MPTPEQTEAERAAAREMLKALEANVIALEDYATRLRGLHMLMVREMIPDIQRGRAAIAAAHAAGIKTGE